MTSSKMFFGDINDWPYLKFGEGYEMPKLEMIAPPACSRCGWRSCYCWSTPRYAGRVGSRIRTKRGTR